MENISKALIMVAGVLLAMLVIAFVVFSFNRMGTWATSEDDEEVIKQREEFNKEYEVYEKNLMYGVDVISCLNKAKSNNDEIQGKYAEKLDNKYTVTVKVKLKSTLTESIRIYYMDQISQKEREYTVGKGPSGNKKLKEIFNPSSGISSISNIKWESNLQAISSTNTKIESGTYILSCDPNGNDTSDTEIKNILGLSTEVKQVVKNTDSSTASASDGWTKAVWETPLYDLKTRKFKCSNLTYNTETGRIDTIEFKEI